MRYFKINNHDFSMYVNKFQVTVLHNYKSVQNAAGNTVVKHVNSKRSFSVGIIPLDAEALETLLQVIKSFTVSISYLEPETNELVENVSCIIPTYSTEYYTIQDSKVMHKAFILQIKEL